MRPLEHSGDSANIAFYRECGAKPNQPHVWCEVLHSVPMKRWPSGVLAADRSRPHTYHCTIYRTGEGEIGAATVERPWRGQPRGPLSERVVTDIVRKALA